MTNDATIFGDEDHPVTGDVPPEPMFSRRHGPFRKGDVVGVHKGVRVPGYNLEVPELYLAEVTEVDYNEGSALVIPKDPDSPHGSWWFMWEQLELVEGTTTPVDEGMSAAEIITARLIEALGPDDTEPYTSRRHPSSEHFHQVLHEMGLLHDRKQSDYGRTYDPFANVRASEDFGLPGWVGSMVRANDKMRRIQKAAEQVVHNEEIQLANESLEDSLLDLAVYTVIALVLLREGK